MQDTMCRELTACALCYLNNPCPAPPCPVVDCPGGGYACQNRTFRQLGGDEDRTGMCLIITINAFKCTVTSYTYRQ